MSPNLVVGMIRDKSWDFGSNRKCPFKFTKTRFKNWIWQLKVKVALFLLSVWILGSRTKTKNELKQLVHLFQYEKLFCICENINIKVVSRKVNMFTSYTRTQIRRLKENVN